MTMLSQQLMGKILAFRAERDWAKFHNLRTLSTSIALEAAELLEHTQWVRDSDLAQVLEKRRPLIEQEIADIVILMSYLVHDLGTDLEMAIEQKLAINANKYPVDRSKGSATKYDEL
ncbi:MAG: nucleotide pyrophosphohydrolase [Luteimonas sp.]